MISPGLFFTGVGIAVIYIIIIGVFLFGCYIFFKMIYKKIKYPIKYKILKKDYDDEDLEIVGKVIDSDIPENSISTTLLLQGYNMEKVREILWILKKMKKKMKGGIKRNER